MTAQADCRACNNHFAHRDSGKIDDALADVFVILRNALRIESGRGAPPPTIRRAGKLRSGVEYDLAPGFTPVPSVTKPDFSSALPGGTLRTHARNEDEVRKHLEIAAKRGLKPYLKDAVHTSEKAPPTELKLTFDLPKVFRAVAKTAGVGACLLVGNERARSALDTDLLRSIKTGVPDIRAFAGLDYDSEWPRILSTVPHGSTPDAKLSGFEHSLLITDVAADWVAYVTLFQEFRFSIRLGARSALPPRGLAVNPRASVLERFIVTFQPPSAYSRRKRDAYGDAPAFAGLTAAIERALATWHREEEERHHRRLRADLFERVRGAGNDPQRQEETIRKWVREIATLEAGGQLQEPLDLAQFPPSNLTSKPSE